MGKAPVLLGESEPFKSNLQVPGGGGGDSSGDKIGGVEWGPPHDLTPTDNSLKSIFNVDQYWGLFKYLNKTRRDCSLVGMMEDTLV